MLHEIKVDYTAYKALHRCPQSPIFAAMSAAMESLRKASMPLVIILMRVETISVQKVIIVG